MKAPFKPLNTIECCGYPMDFKGTLIWTPRYRETLVSRTFMRHIITLFFQPAPIHKNLFEILLNQTKIRVYLPFSDWFPKLILVWLNVISETLPCEYTLRKLDFHLFSNKMGYDRGDSFLFDFAPNGVPIGTKS